MGNSVNNEQLHEELRTGYLLGVLAECLPDYCPEEVFLFIDHSDSMFYGYDKTYYSRFRRLADIIGTLFLHSYTNCRVFTYSHDFHEVHVEVMDDLYTTMKKLTADSGMRRERPEKILSWLCTNQLKPDRIIFVSDNIHRFQQTDFCRALDKYFEAVGLVEVVVVWLDYWPTLDVLQRTFDEFYFWILRGFSDNIISKMLDTYESKKKKATV